MVMVHSPSCVHAPNYTAKSVNIRCMASILPKKLSTTFRHSSINSLTGTKSTMGKNEMHKGHWSKGTWGVATAILYELSMTLLICNLEPKYEYVRMYVCMYRWEIDRPSKHTHKNLLFSEKLRRTNQVVPGTKHRNVLGSENTWAWFIYTRGLWSWVHT